MKIRILALVGLLLFTALPISHAADESPRGADFFPDTVILYAEMPNPASLVDLALDHPLRHRIESLDAIQDAYNTPQFHNFQAAVTAIEGQLGESWPQVIKSVAANGVAIAIDAPTQGIAMVITAEDAASPRQLIKTLSQLAGAAGVVETKKYRGLTVHRLNDARVAILGKSILVTNKADFGQRIVDMHLDQAQDTLANSTLHQQAQKLAPGDATIWGYVNTTAMRQGGIAKDLFKGRADNPVVEVLVGGILANLTETPLASFAVSLSNEQLNVDLTTPHQDSWVGEERKYFFGPAGKGAAPPLLHVDGELLSVSTYRDASEMWLRAGDLFDENVNEGFAQADSVLATLFSGKDFAEDILGAVDPQIQLIVARQQFDPETAQPSLKLPEFALALRLKDPKTMRPEFRRTFQSLIGFLNVTGAMNGQPQLDLGSEKDGDKQLITATYLPDQDADPARLPINFNFSPSLGFVQDRVVVSSTKSLAAKLLDQIVNEAQPKARTNTIARADLAGLRKILEDNRGQLVAQNMLSEGHTKEEAEHEIGVLLDILNAAKTASLQLTNQDRELRLSLSLTFTPAEVSAAP